MKPHLAPNVPFRGPIDPNWTIEELLLRLAEEDAPVDELRPELLRIEAAMSAAAGGPRWSDSAGAGTPTVVALTRSIALLHRAAPALRAMRLGELPGEPLGEPPGEGRAPRGPARYVAISA